MRTSPARSIQATAVKIGEKVAQHFLDGVETEQGSPSVERVVDSWIRWVRGADGSETHIPDWAIPTDTSSAVHCHRCLVTGVPRSWRSQAAAAVAAVALANPGAIVPGQAASNSSAGTAVRLRSSTGVRVIALSDQLCGAATDMDGHPGTAID
jgi:hypothetical protein